MKRWMVDIESLGNQPGGVILSVGWVRFSIEGGADIETAKERRISVRSCFESGLAVDHSTIEWWLSQPGLPWSANAKSVDLAQALLDLNEDVTGSDQLWAKPPSYDIAAIRHAMSLVGIVPKWSFRSELCLRTMLRLLSSTDELVVPIRDESLKHSAMFDAIQQADLCAAALRRLRVQERA